MGLRVKEDMSKNIMKEEIMKDMKDIHYSPDVMGLKNEHITFQSNFDHLEVFK